LGWESAGKPDALQTLSRGAKALERRGSVWSALSLLPLSVAAERCPPWRFVDTYFALGVKSCWVVSPPMHSIQILTVDGKEIVLNSGKAADPVTGLTADLAAVFS